MIKHMKIQSLIIVLFALVLASCKSGIDFESMDINPEHIIDYGLRAKEDKLGIGVKAYAAIKTGSSSAGSYAFSADLAAIERSLKVIVDLPYSNVFGAAGNSAVTAFKTYIDGIVLSIRSRAEAAASSSNGAIDLLNELGTKSLSSGFAGNLNSQIQELAKNVPQEAKAIADANTKIIENSIKRIYQHAAVLSQSLVQKEARAKVGLILKSFDELLKKAQNDPALIGGPRDRELAISEVDKASNRFKNAQTEIGKMSTLSKVKPNLVAYVSGNLADLKRDYIDKAPSAKDLYDEAERARLELDTLLGLWREDIKNGPHAGLENTVRTAFDSVSLLSEAVDVSDETDLMRLMRLLVSKSLVVTSADDNFVEALGGAVAMNIALELGLPVSNVYALNPASLNDTKSTFGMDDDAFGLYVSSQAEKIYQFTAQDGEYGNIFVLFVDRMASGLKSADVINKLKQGKSKVVLVTANPTQYDDAANFAPQGLDLAAAYHVAKAVVSDADPSLNANYIAQVQAKIMYAFRKSPRQMSLNAVITAAKDAVARLRDRPSLSESEYNQAIKDALASLANNSYDVSLVEQSKLLSADVSVIVANIKNSQDYYINYGRGYGDTDLRSREIDEQKRARDENRRLQATINNSNARRLKLNQLNLAYNLYKADLDGILAAKNLSDKARNYRSKVEELRLDAIGTLTSMDTLLSDPLCYFPETNADRGYQTFYNNVSKQEFDMDLTKNPMSLFTITKRTVTKPAAPSTKDQAAISLNCFLTGRGALPANDNHRVLKTKVGTIMAEVNKITTEADTIATTMMTNNIALAQPEYEKLASHIKPDIAGPALNPVYWKTNLNVFGPHAVGGVAASNYGADFDVKAYLKIYPRNNVLLLPATNSLGVNLPSDIFAEYTYGGGGVWDEVNNRYDISSGGVKWSIARVYARALKAGPANMVIAFNPPNTLGFPAVNVPVSIPTHDEFSKLNHRIWAWFLSRIVGKINDQIPLVNIGGVNPDTELYVPQGPTDYFDNNHVFITRLFSETNNFLQEANRYIIAKRALLVLDEYKRMAKLLYDLAPDDFNAFLNQAPPNPLVAYFKRIEDIMSAHAGINNIMGGNNAAVTAWLGLLFHAEVEAVLPGSLNPVKFTGAVPLGGGENARLAPIWPMLVAAATAIDAEKAKIVLDVAKVNP